jgi:hypothetical protein
VCVAHAEVVFERCDRPGGVRETLLPYAIVALTFFTVGYPCLVAFILYRSRFLIMEDQLLRAQDRGASRLENPHCYDVRKMYHKCVCGGGVVVVPVTVCARREPVLHRLFVSAP